MNHVTPDPNWMSNAHPVRPRLIGTRQLYPQGEERGSPSTSDPMGIPQGLGCPLTALGAVLTADSDLQVPT